MARIEVRGKEKKVLFNVGYNGEYFEISQDNNVEKYHKTLVNYVEEVLKEKINEEVVEIVRYQSEHIKEALVVSDFNGKKDIKITKNNTFFAEYVFDGDRTIGTKEVAVTTFSEHLLYWFETILTNLYIL